MAAAVQTAPNGMQYSGNPDFRGYVAAVAPEFLGYVGNDGGINMGALNKVGGIDSNYAQKSLNVQGAVNAIHDLASKYSSYQQSSGSGGSGSSSSGSTTDPNAVAYYNDLINQLTTQLQGAQGEQATGLQNIDTGYNNAVTQEGQTRDQASAQNMSSREQNVGKINENAYSAYDSLMGLLGKSGAGVSSAANTNAPFAVAKNASGERSGANYTYNSNDQNIKTSYANALNDLLNQKNQNTQQFLTGLLQQEGQLQQQIGSAKINASEYGGKSYAQSQAGAASDTAAVQGIQQQLNDIFSKYGTPSYTPAAAPNLASFTADPTTIKAENANPQTDSSVLPYLTQLNKQPDLLTGANAAQSAPLPTGAA